MWKSKARYFLAWSSGPQLLPIYRRMYRLTIGMAVLMFRNCRGIRAAYLSRGCSKGEITPGISDIDFVLIVNGDARQRQRAENVFRLLQIVTAGLIPYHPAYVLTEEELHYRWRNTPYWRYRLQEGKSNWSLLQGREALSSLPVISDIERTTSCCAEMNYWWVQFCDFILQNEKYRDDFVMRNSTCYKAVAEVLNARHALNTGEFCYSKEEGLRRADSQLARKLLDAAAKNFLGADRSLEQETYRFLIDAFLDLWDGFRDDPFLEVYSDVVQEVDSADQDLQKEKLEEPFGEICRHLSDHWGGRCRGVHLVKSAFWKIEDSLLLIDVDPASLPTLDDLDGLIAVRKRVYNRQRPAAYFFLRLGRVAFPITPALPQDFHRGVLTPATAPDVFLQLGEKVVYWTKHTSWYLTDWLRNRQWPDASPLKRSQLNMIARSAAVGRVRYPLSLRSISERETTADEGHENS
jgi:hypothetical protein